MIASHTIPTSRERKQLLSRTVHAAAPGLPSRAHAQLNPSENSNGFLRKLGKLLIGMYVYPYNEEVLWACRITRMSKEFFYPLQSTQNKSTM